MTRREGNISALCKIIERFLERNPERAAFLAEQPDDNEFMASYRAFSSRPDLGTDNAHADSGNRSMIGFAGNYPRGLGADLADEISAGYAERERYGENERNILYHIKRKSDKS